MDLDTARYASESIIFKLKPYCDRIMVGGSIRRQRNDINDIDLIVIPKRIEITDMFDNVIGTQPVKGFCDVINSWQKIKGDPTGKYCQRIVNGHKVEIAIATRDNFGNLLIIRTGDSDFSHKLMILARQRGLEQRDGYLYKGDKLIPCYEEKDYFAALGIQFIEPHQRNEHAFRGHIR